MYNMSENNARNGRRSALILAIMLHLGLVALLYLSTADKSPKPTLAADPAKTEKSQPAAKARVVKLP
ncbi:MAG: hypothetical protein L6Q97_20885 [Thermoanaerobaculia bacterium]|nr:hypothetical protein [Thermoanaerobaculia bacterium]